MNKINIPIEFTIFGQVYNIIITKDLVEKEDNVGLIKYRENKIILQDNNSNLKRPTTHLEQSYLHELVHAILHGMSEYELGENEKFVNLFASALHQILQTSKYKTGV